MNDFVEVGFPAVRSAQEYTSTRLNVRYMSTIATSFSAVTTGMIQIAILTTGLSLDTVASLFLLHQFACFRYSRHRPKSLILGMESLFLVSCSLHPSVSG